MGGRVFKLGGDCAYEIIQELIQELDIELQVIEPCARAEFALGILEDVLDRCQDLWVSGLGDEIDEVDNDFGIHAMQVRIKVDHEAQPAKTPVLDVKIFETEVIMDEPENGSEQFGNLKGLSLGVLDEFRLDQLIALFRFRDDRLVLLADELEGYLEYLGDLLHELLAHVAEQILEPGQKVDLGIRVFVLNFKQLQKVLDYLGVVSRLEVVIVLLVSLRY